MNLLKTGLIELHKQFSELKQGWDGYDGRPIDKDVLDSVKCMGFVSDIIKLFEKVGFAEKDIEVVPTPRGTIQYEAERRNVYLEIEIDSDYYFKWKIDEDKSYGKELVEEKKKGRPTIVNDRLKAWILERHNDGVSSRKIAERLSEIGVDIHFNTILNAIGKEDEKDGEM